MLLNDVICGAVMIFITGYLIGSIPFGLLLAKIAGYGDIRAIGSGNIGATNVLRTGNKKLALAVLILDGGKGAVAVELAKWAAIWLSIVTENFYYEMSLLPLLAGFGAILGHVFPVWLKFKGGKGVATTLGTLLAAVPPGGIAAVVAWAMTALLARISSLAAIVAMIIAPPVTLFFYGAKAALIVLAISGLVIFRHKENIKRLVKGEEPSIGRKK